MTAMQRQRVRRISVAAGVIAVLVGLYALAGFVVVPRVARDTLETLSQRLLGQPARMGAVTFNPFTLVATVSKVSVPASPAAGAPVVLAFERLRLQLAARSLWQRTWVLRDLELQSPRAHLLIGPDGRLSIPGQRSDAAGATSSLRAATPSGRTPRPTGAHSELRWQVDRLVLSGGRLDIDDRSGGHSQSLRLEPIALQLSDLRSVPSPQGRGQLALASAAGGRLRWRGAFSLAPLSSSGTVQIDALRTDSLAAWLPAGLALRPQGGVLDLRASYRWGVRDGLALQVSELSLRGLSLNELAVGAAGTTADPIELPVLSVRGLALSSTAQRLTIASVRLQQPSLSLHRRADGTLDWLALLEHATVAGSASVAAPVVPAAPVRVVASLAAKPSSVPTTAPHWSMQLATLVIDRGALRLEDEGVRPAVRLVLQPLSLTMKGFDSAGRMPVDVQVQAGLGGQAHLQGHAHVTLEPLQAGGQLNLQRFALATLQPYLARSLALTLYRGQLSAYGEFRYAGGARPPTPRLLLTGTLTVSDFATRDDALHADFLTGRKVQLQRVRYQERPDSLHIARILAQGVYGRVMIGPDGTLNLTRVIAPLRALPAATGAPAKPARPAPAGASGVPIRVDRIDWQDGTADFTDRSVQPNFSAAILGLHGQISGLSSESSSRARVQLQGSVNRYAPVSIQGQINVLSAATYTDLTMHFDNIELTTFNPYSGKFAGYSIAQGKLSTQMHYLVRNGQLNATHHVEIDGLEFGPPTASKPAVPLPIKLAAALLKDRHGMISIDLPVSGSLSDPQFRLAPILWKAFTGLLRKVVTAPFAWLGSLFGSGPQLAYVDFAPGSALLTPEQQHKLAQLAGALVARPQLSLQIPLHTSNALDDGTLAQAALDQALTSQQTAAPAAPTASRSAPGGAAPADPQLLALAMLYRRQFHVAPAYPQELSTDAERIDWLKRQLLPAYQPQRAQRDALARARASAVQAALLANPALSPSRIYLVQALSGGGPSGVVRMQLTLQ